MARSYAAVEGDRTSTTRSGAPVVLKHSNDDPVIYTAVSGKADALCTLDSDFLEAAVVAFCRDRDISIVTDVQLLQRLAEMR